MFGRIGLSRATAAFAGRTGAAAARNTATPLVRNSAKAGVALTAAGLLYSTASQKAVEAEDSNAAAIAGAGVAGVVVGTVLGYLYESQNSQKVEKKFERYWPKKVMILFGKPGAGKGTQGPKISDELDLPTLSTGDMLRAAVAEGTPVGKKAEAVMKSGGLVGDDIVMGIIHERIQKDDCKTGFILDGMPRTLAQAQMLDEMLAKTGDRVTNVLALDVEDGILEERIVHRWIHKKSGASYHVKNAPPKSMKLLSDGNPNPKTMLDDATGEPLIRRPDDTKEALGKRLSEYRNQTVPIYSYYEKHGICKTVNGFQSITKVWEDVQAAMSKQ